jgi:hypothetical protein
VSITVEPYDASLRDVWTDVVRRVRQPHFLFERGYMDYHADRFPDASLLVLRKGTPVGAVVASRRGDEVVSHGGLTFGGLISDASLTTAAAVEAMGLAATAYRAAGARSWSYKAVPHTYHEVPAEEDLFALVTLGARLQARHVSSAVPAGGPVEYSSERRRAVRRGGAAELELVRCDDFEEFMELEREVLLRRHGVEPVHTAHEMRLLADRFPEQIALHVAREDGAIVAGVLVFATPVVAHAQYIGASERGRELRAGDALFDHLIREVYATTPWFDFGISNERDGTLNAGLARNKEGFGARAVVYDRYALDLG